MSCSKDNYVLTVSDDFVLLRSYVTGIQPSSSVSKAYDDIKSTYSLKKIKGNYITKVAVNPVSNSSDVMQRISGYQDKRGERFEDIFPGTS